ncbi:CxxH/CxxC protein [Shouchella lonarensis]|uniref:CxxH/CxxC protein, BA_5709 family n=1 Tax=Shouchella lonarensis TaxID=1464122 RepID=A0A1G6LWS2_9BACI|nr:CxxH/CxxC protein [Shouchella lonarensis]SDC47659.1 CxxH/CxxC protein, BA_5709 family [Shouchella lonarensis]
MLYACQEHVELALDVAVDTYECAPIMEKLEQSEEMPLTCMYCADVATYKVLKK